MKVPINPQTKVPTGQLGYQRVHDVSSGTRALGQVVRAYGEEYQREEKKRELFDIQKMLVDETIAIQTDFDARQQNAPLGAAGFTQDINNAYGERHDQLVGGLRERGYSDEAINEFETRLGTVRSTYVAKAIDFQDKSQFAKIGKDIDEMAVSASQYAQNNPDAYQSALDEGITAIANSGLDAVEQQKAYESYRKTVMLGAQQGAAIKYADVIIGLYEPAELAPADTVDVGDGQEFDLNAYLKKLPGAEGTGQNPNSSAFGHFQFTKSTWLDYYKTVFGNTGETKAQILAKRKDVAVATTLAGKFTGDNITALNAAGKPVNDTTVYLSHFLGSPDTLKVLNANTDATLVGLIDQDSIDSNKSIFRKVKTVGDLLGWASGKMGVQMQPGGQIVQAPPPTGLITPGNIVVASLPVVHNEDGSVSTVRSISIEEDGKTILIPTVIDGAIVSDAKAVDVYHQTGQHLGIFKTPAAADTQAQVIHENEARRVGFDAKGKTGIPIIDASSGPERMQMLAWAKAHNSENNANFKAQVGVTHENAVNSYLTTGGYAGEAPKLENYIKAYGPVVGPQKFSELDNAAKVGGNIQQFKTMSNSAISSQVEALRPKNTASPTYTVELAAYTKAREAADSIFTARKENPSEYLFATFPNIAANLAAAKTPDQRRAAYSAINEAYKKIGIPQAGRYLLTKEQAQELQESYEAMPPKQKIHQLDEWYNELGGLHLPFLNQLTENGQGAGADNVMWAALRRHPQGISIMSQILAGQQIIKEDPARKPGADVINTSFKDTIGSSIANLNPTASRIFNDAAAAIYVAKGGRTDSEKFSEDLYEESLRLAVGGLPGNPNSGIVNMTEGRVKDWTLLPQRTTRQQFTNWVERLTPGVLTRLSVEKLPPIYRTGNPVPLNDIIDEGVFVAVAPNHYIIKMISDGNPLLTASGNKFIVRIFPGEPQNLPPIANQKAPPSRRLPVRGIGRE